MTTFQGPVALVARLMLALLFIPEGWAKIFAYSGTVQYMERYGVPGALLPLVILTEFGGGLLVACGFLTRIAALALAGFCVLTALLFHNHWSDPNDLVHFYKDIAIAGGFLGLVAFGAGDWAIDALIGRPILSDASTAPVGEHRG